MGCFGPLTCRLSTPPTAGRLGRRTRRLPGVTTDHDDLDDGDPGAELPEELDASGYRGPYTFPDNSRRRVPGVIHLVVAAACLVLWVTAGDGGVLVNGGMLLAAVLLGALGAYHLLAGVHLAVRETDALVAASKQVGFPVGHASAQLAWRGLRSRPTWRILLYSSEEPPLQRGLVLVDGVDGSVVAHFVEDNPEDWTVFDSKQPAGSS